MTMSKIVAKVDGRIDKRIRAATTEVFKNIIMMTPVDTGRAKNNWQCTVGEPYDGETMDGGVEKMRAAVPAKAGSVVYLTNNVPYIQSLEYEGHSKQAPDGMVRVSLALFERVLNGSA